MENATTVTPDLSLVILCYRSGHSVIPFVSQAEGFLQELTQSYEIVLVANYIEGSDDDTWKYATQLQDANSRIRAICKPKEGMMGWDMRSGLSMSKGKYICVIDGDGQFPLSSIKMCYDKILEGNHDLVKTHRVNREDGLYRKTISTVYNFLFNLIFPGLQTKDANSKPKVLTREAYEKMTLTSDDWFIDAEIMISAIKLNLRIFEFPVEFSQLVDRKSFVKPAAILEFLSNMYRFWRLNSQKMK